MTKEQGFRTFYDRNGDDKDLMTPFVIDDALSKAEETAHTHLMTVSECESLIRKLVKQYKARPHKITERQAVAMLDARNEAARREDKPTYTTVREFLTRSMVSPGE